MAVLVLMTATLVLFRATSLGLRMRASAFAGEISRLLGVRVGLLLTLGWALAGVAGSLAGLLVAPTSSFGPYYMDLVLVYAFTAAVIGGLESPVGALIGGLITGLSISYVGGYLGSGLAAAGCPGPADGGAHGPARRDLRPTARPGGCDVPQPAVAESRRAGWRAVAPAGSGLRRSRSSAISSWPCGGAAILYLLTSSLSPYNDFEVGEIALYVIALAGLSLLTGVNGQISLGHGAFMAVGAYTTALLMTHTHLNFVVELLASIGAAAALGPGHRASRPPG